MSTEADGSTADDSKFLAQRVAELSAGDPQFAAARPSATIAAAIEKSAPVLPAVIRTTLEGYADRPALGRRAVQFVSDPRGSRTSLRLLPKFDTITYRELWDWVGALSRGLTEGNGSVSAGDRVAVLGFTSADYAALDLALACIGAVSVPLQTSSAISQLQPIVIETEPTVIAASIEYLSDAVELVAEGARPTRVLVFDYHGEVDDHREALEAARTSLANNSVLVDTLGELAQRGRDLPAAPVIEPGDNDPLALLVYTSGSTGAPKGAMYLQSTVATMWVRSGGTWFGTSPASITLNVMPMSHIMGRAILYGTLGNGGTAYFGATSDLSLFLEDLALVRPTELNCVPRIWEMLFGEFQREVDLRMAKSGNATGGEGRTAIESQVLQEQREDLLGNRCVFALTGSAPTSAELKNWVGSLLGLKLVDGLGSTEAGIIWFDGHVQRQSVIDYKLVDVPDLGYFHTDKPHPRGELLIKTAHMFPGYYKRPEITAAVFDDDGYYRTGDVVAQVGPDQLEYVDRRNNVLKLAQGEFVTVAKLEALFGNCPLVRQIYVYGNSANSYLLAVVVPTQEALDGHLDGDHMTELKQLIADSLHSVAKDAGLQSYEVPRDFIIESTPFTPENGLLTGIRKLARPKLKQHYGERLEQLYAELAEGHSKQLDELRRTGAAQPVLETVSRATAALLGGSTADPAPEAHFTDLGGDSLSALTFANLLNEIFDVEVPVGVIVSPTSDLRSLAHYIEAEQAPGASRPTFARVHGRDAVEVHARDLTLDKFLDADTLSASNSLPGPTTNVRTVLLTGATGFLGRYLALHWLEQLDLVDGTLICLVRGKSDDDARQRLDATFDSGDPHLLTHYQDLAADHLEVIAGDKAEQNLGLSRRTWQRLAASVDLIVDSAALVNHVLPYSQLFGPNVLGTAELIRIALTTKVKPVTYLSTIAVGDQTAPGTFTEYADIREISQTRAVDQSYANGYGNSKWAGEVLLREANELCGLPVAVFRCDMILADVGYRGQLNVPDMFTRMMLSLVATGIAPGSFYQLDGDGNRQRAHYDGLPVEFIAEAVSRIGVQTVDGFATYHVMNPHDDGIGLDEFVDWLIDAGYGIARIADYDAWVKRFETTLRALPDKQRQASLLPLLHNYQVPATPIRGSIAPTARFRTEVRNSQLLSANDIPHISPQVVIKYITDLQLLGLL
ncbi:MAG: thioester reductase domain-containing protein [Actinomycetia bacterium]|nr:thioester reductase domain-containing protein [Actinomycetes bacterium]